MVWINMSRQRLAEKFADKFTSILKTMNLSELGMFTTKQVSKDSKIVIPGKGEFAVTTSLFTTPCPGDSTAIRREMYSIVKWGLLSCHRLTTYVDVISETKYRLRMKFHRYQMRDAEISLGEYTWTEALTPLWLLYMLANARFGNTISAHLRSIWHWEVNGASLVGAGMFDAIPIKAASNLNETIFYLLFLKNPPMHAFLGDSYERPFISEMPVLVWGLPGTSFKDINATKDVSTIDVAFPLPQQTRYENTDATKIPAIHSFIQALAVAGLLEGDD